ncbi:MAG: hypothetical protein CO109_01975, partial [Deltaproteobacteria bacterium CG_4_9_14_3_um_filter_65_9]
MPAVLLLLFAFVGAPAFAAENDMVGSPPALPADLTPDQAEMARRYLESHPEARKALEAAQQQKEREAREGVKPGDETAEGGKKDLAPAPRYDWR